MERDEGGGWRMRELEGRDGRDVRRGLDKRRCSDALFCALCLMGNFLLWMSKTSICLQIHEDEVACSVIIVSLPARSSRPVSVNHAELQDLAVIASFPSLLSGGKKQNLHVTSRNASEQMPRLFTFWDQILASGRSSPRVNESSTLLDRRRRLRCSELGDDVSIQAGWRRIGDP